MKRRRQSGDCADRPRLPLPNDGEPHEYETGVVENINQRRVRFATIRVDSFGYGVQADLRPAGTRAGTPRPFLFSSFGRSMAGAAIACGAVS